jgi:hypothetical protein
LRHHFHREGSARLVLPAPVGGAMEDASPVALRALCDAFSIAEAG